MNALQTMQDRSLHDLPAHEAILLLETDRSRGLAQREAEARTVAVNMFVLVELFYLFNCRSLTRSVFQVGLFSNPWVTGGVLTMIGLQLLLTYVPAMHRLFHTAPIGLEAWAGILAVAGGVFLIVEVEKWVRRQLARTAGDPSRAMGTTRSLPAR